MKKAKMLVAAALVCMMGLSGCGNDYHADENTVYVEKKGKVVTTELESFPEDTYDKAELEEYINNEISAYNDENGEKSVVLESITVEEGMAEMILSYASAEDYAKFTGKEFFSGSVAEALAAGYTFDGQFVEASSGEVCTAETATEDGTLKVVMISGETALNVNGTIVYYTDGFVKLENKNTISISKENVNSTEGVEENTTETQGGQEVIGTEDDGSVSNEELVTGEEEIVFEFEEDEPEVVEEEIYTCVIYKEK